MTTSVVKPVVQVYRELSKAKRRMNGKRKRDEEVDISIRFEMIVVGEREQESWEHEMSFKRGM